MSGRDLFSVPSPLSPPSPLSLPPPPQPAPRNVIADAVNESLAMATVLREEAREVSYQATLASMTRMPPMPRLAHAPTSIPDLDPPPLLGTTERQWWRGNTLAIDLADWLLKLEMGWSYSVGADLWVWVTLREGSRFTTECQQVEKLLAALADAESYQDGRRYAWRPRGGAVATSGRAARDGLVYGAGSALARGAAAPWHYVVRSRSAMTNCGDDLLSYSWTIAPTPAGEALHRWAEAVTGGGDSVASVDGGDESWAARMRERKALWRDYKRSVAGGETWQVGF